MVILIVVALIGCGAWWLLRTDSGAQFVLKRAESALKGKLSVGALSGSLTGPLKLDNVHWEDPASGVDVEVRTVAVNIAALPLLLARVHVRSLNVDGVNVALTSVPPKPDERSGEFSLKSPVDIQLDAAKVSDVSVRQEGQPVFIADTLALAGAWTGNGVLVRDLALRSPDGQVDLHGTIGALPGYPGNGDVTFTWNMSDVKYAGALKASSTGSLVKANVALTSPTPATLIATIAQTDDLDWTAQVQVPAFDPALLQPPEARSESSVKALALALTGRGDKRNGTLAGTIGLNEHNVRLEEARYGLTGQTLTLTTLKLTSPEAQGSFEANGIVQLDADPVLSEIKARWTGVELPADLVGQPLATHGNLAASGSAKAYHAEGALALGPPGKLADITLDIDGTPDVVTLRKVALVQKDAKGRSGGLDAQGSITLKPAVGWQVEAKATRLDPGAFFSDWPGAVNFVLATQGTMTDQGPDATIALDDLGGTLRQRDLSGNADLAVHPGYKLEGDAMVAIGDSRVTINGQSADTTDATVKIIIASLADWLPDAQGSVDGAFAITGKWPKLNVKGGADGTAIALGGTRIEKFRLNANVVDIEKPHGHLDLEATNVLSGALAFRQVRVNAEGDQASHQMTLDATGDPLSAKLALNGAMQRGQWSGTLGKLDLDVRDVPPFHLTESAQLAWKGGQFSLSETCLAGERMRLCVGANSEANGSLAAHYQLDHLPLALIAGLAAPDAPLKLEGEIEGRGNITRTSSGALSGTANLTSTNGSVTYIDEPSKPLLSYTDFALKADIDPAVTHATLHAALDRDGKLDADVTLSGAAGQPQALAGRIDAHLGSVAFVELLSPEVANVKGTLAANYTLAGSTSAPKFSGILKLADFAAEIPSAGLKLHDGEVTATARDAEHFDIDGTLASGDGKLVIGGSGGIAGGEAARVTIKGENFLAADIPAARVVISPDVVIERTTERIEVGGSVSIPKANIDLAKLPGGGVSSVSPDVVVVDEEQPEAGATLPVVVRVTVKLGDDVKLAGFGLDGKVAGDLRVAQLPGRAPTGTGTISVSGTYKAYGQDLKIESGHLLFAGTPLGNPGLDIKAARTVRGVGSFGSGDITSGLQIRGTALVPVLTVYSNPTMAQSEALSYIVTGKPLSGLNSGEGAMLGTAARALGTAGGDLLAKGLGSRLGIDATVSDSAALGGAAFTVGKYLSPKLYLSYGVGVFDPGEVVTLRYIFNRRFDFEAENATTGNRAGINYRYER